MKTTGLIPVSAKPYHIGHDTLVRIASEENDKVVLFVSLVTRGIINGMTMESIWKKLIEPTIPSNVGIVYGGSPIGNVWKFLESYENSKNLKFRIYSDVEDIEKNFSFASSKWQKYVPTLMSQSLIETRSISRNLTSNISGHRMRNFISERKKEEFIKFVPQKIDGNEYWKMLCTNK